MQIGLYVDYDKAKMIIDEILLEHIGHREVGVLEK